MNSKSLVIRADANSEIGTGHVMRMIALGQAWQDSGGSVSFLSNAPDAMLARCQAAGFKVERLEKSYPASAEDLPSLLKAVEACGAEWLALDNYFYDLPYQKAIRAAGFKLLLVDDFNHQPEYEADVLLNQNAGAESIAYKLNAGCKALLGAKYALLRREFRTEKAPARDFSNGVRKILLTFGGADPANATMTAMEAAERCVPEGVETLVLAGAANRRRESIEAFIAKSKTSFKLLTDIKDMPALLKTVDLAITAGGSTCWELARFGVPMLVESIAENQERLSSELARRKAAVFAGRAGEVKAEALAEALSSLLKDPSLLARMSANGAKMIDARGALRTIRAMLEDELNLRPATLDDAGKTLAWRNSPEARAGSFNSKEISLEEHLRWLERKLASPRTDLLIVSLGGFEAGTLRYDCEGEGAEISICLNPHWIGSGLGAKAIAAGSAFLFSKRPLAKFIEAGILPENIASQRSFEAAGFTKRADGKWELKRKEP